MSIKLLFPTMAAAAAAALALAPPALAAPPANDAFESPAVLGDAPSSTGGTLDEATTQSGEPSHGFQTVWYVFRPAASRRVAIEVPERIGTDVVLSVYTGSTLGGLHRVDTTADYEPRLAFDAVAGQEYRVAVGSQWIGASGTRFTLGARVSPLPANDAFDDAARLRVPRLYSGNLADSTNELGENAGHGHSVWYRFRGNPRGTGRVTIEASGSCAQVWLYRGTELSSLRPVKNGSTIRFTPRRNTAYRLAVGDQTLADVREDGLRGIVSTRRKATVEIRLEVSRRTARRLGLGSRVLGSARGVVDYRQALPAVVRLTRQARRALADEDSLHVKVVLELPSTVRDRFIRIAKTL
jgi:hypothetical protein